MSVVTIRGQLGSGAPEIAKLVAAKTRADYVDSEIIAEVAKLLNWGKQEVANKEMPDGGIMGRVAAAVRRSPFIFEEPADDKRYKESLTAVIEDLAVSGAIVIRGRGSQFILRNWPGALHVLVVCPLPLRARRVSNEHGTDIETAKKEISRFDASRKEFIKKYFKRDLEDSIHYDLVINTHRIEFDEAATIIANAVPLKRRE